jgi:hypothetical protein
MPGSLAPARRAHQVSATTERDRKPTSRSRDLPVYREPRAEHNRFQPLDLGRTDDILVNFHQDLSNSAKFMCWIRSCSPPSISTIRNVGRMRRSSSLSDLTGTRMGLGLLISEGIVDETRKSAPT